MFRYPYSEYQSIEHPVIEVRILDTKDFNFPQQLRNQLSLLVLLAVNGYRVNEDTEPTVDAITDLILSLPEMQEEDYYTYVGPYTYTTNPELNMGHLKEIELATRNNLRAAIRKRILGGNNGK